MELQENGIILLTNNHISKFVFPIFSHFSSTKKITPQPSENYTYPCPRYKATLKKKSFATKMLSTGMVEINLKQTSNHWLKDLKRLGGYWFHKEWSGCNTLIHLCAYELVKFSKVRDISTTICIIALPSAGIYDLDLTKGLPAVFNCLVWLVLGY